MARFRVLVCGVTKQSKLVAEPVGRMEMTLTLLQVLDKFWGYFIKEKKTMGIISGLFMQHQQQLMLEKLF